MTSRKRIGLAAGLVLGMLSVAAMAAPASAAWWGNGQWHPDNRWNDNRNNNDWNNRYYGYHYRQPPVIYDNTPGFTIRIQ
jgi:hypothetical protein